MIRLPITRVEFFDEVVVEVGSVGVEIFLAGDLTGNNPKMGIGRREAGGEVENDTKDTDDNYRGFERLEAWGKRESGFEEDDNQERPDGEGVAGVGRGGVPPEEEVGDGEEDVGEVAYFGF